MTDLEKFSGGTIKLSGDTWIWQRDDYCEICDKHRALIPNPALNKAGRFPCWLISISRDSNVIKGE